MRTTFDSSDSLGKGMPAPPWYFWVTVALAAVYAVGYGWWMLVYRHRAFKQRLPEWQASGPDARRSLLRLWLARDSRATRHASSWSRCSWSRRSRSSRTSMAG